MIEDKVKTDFRTLYEGIVARINQHPEVELRGTALDRGPFADINVDLYVAPYDTIGDASRLNEILYSLKPENIDPVQSIDASVNNEFYFLRFGILGFKVEIGEKRKLRSTIMTPDALLEAIDDNSVIERGVYTAGIRLWVVPDKKFVYQNCNGIFVVDGISCGLYELDKEEQPLKTAQVPAEKPKRWYQRLFSSLR